MINIKKAASALAVMLLCLGMNTTSAFASQPDETKQLIANMSEIEHNLTANGTSVETELSKLIREYQEDQKNDSLTTEEKSHLMSLANQVKKQLSDYTDYKKHKKERGKFHAIYSTAVATVVAYFVSQDYALATELLVHAQKNATVGSLYTPVSGFRVTKSPVFWNLRKSAARRGSAEFPNSGNHIQKDLYYAIHSFDWHKSGSYIIITDFYDFDRGDLHSIAGVAIRTMHLAQQEGVLIPYHVSIKNQ